PPHIGLGVLDKRPLPAAIMAEDRDGAETGAGSGLSPAHPPFHPFRAYRSQPCGRGCNSICPSLVPASMAATSSSLSTRLLSTPRLSLSWSSVRTPISAEVISLRRSTQLSASCTMD